MSEALGRPGPDDAEMQLPPRHVEVDMTYEDAAVAAFFPVIGQLAVTGERSGYSVTEVASMIPEQEPDLIDMHGLTTVEMLTGEVDPMREQFGAGEFVDLQTDGERDDNELTAIG